LGQYRNDGAGAQRDAIDVVPVPRTLNRDLHDGIRLACGSARDAPMAGVFAPGLVRAAPGDGAAARMASRTRGNAYRIKECRYPCI
jgi:hypothetical protein